MQLNLATIFNDPRLMLFGFDGDYAQFTPMTRETYARSIFMDNRVQPAEGAFIRVPLDPLLAYLAETGFKPPRIKFIHHFAQSGSTLLARALDVPPNLVVREPLHLRQLGVAYGAGAQGSLTQDQGTVLAFSLAMLGKRFTAESSLIAKGNVPISLLADDIAELDPGQAAILLYFPLEDYCAAVLRTSNHRAWLESVTAEIRLETDPDIGATSMASPAEKAAALWFSMIKRFSRLLARNPSMRSLDANKLFDCPVETITAASDLLDAGIDHVSAKQIVSGPLFSTYSKNPAMPYDGATRVERRQKAKELLASELQLARNWVDQRAKQAEVPSDLGPSLIGEPASLF